MKPIILGKGPDGDILIDLPKLVRTRMLVQANSGGGKSWAVRRILEQTFGQIQHIVIDPEGEFASLREKFDYVLAAPVGGDTAIDVTGRRGEQHTRLLAHRLLELNASAILDIYELDALDRIRFVKIFLQAMVNAPKNLWHPVLVVLDEAHTFAPQKGDADSSRAVAEMSSKGRKRGYCLVPATQRISKLSKDVAAEANNKLIGRCVLDIDMHRAAEELGLTSKDGVLGLRKLAPGEFFTFGPAIADDVTRVMVGPVVTTHPEAGAVALAPPAPTDKIRALLPKLADLPAEAEQEARTVDELKKQLADARRKLTVAAIAPSGIIAPCDHKPLIREHEAKAAEREREIVRLTAVAERLGRSLDASGTDKETLRQMLSETKRQSRQSTAELTKELGAFKKWRANVTERLQSILNVTELLGATAGDPARAESGMERHGSAPDLVSQRELDEAAGRTIQAAKDMHDRTMATLVRSAASKEPRRLTGLTTEKVTPTYDGMPLQGPHVKVLNAIAWCETFMRRPAQQAVCFLAGYTWGGGYFKPRGELAKMGLVVYGPQNTINLSDEGRTMAEVPDTPPSIDDLHDKVLKRLDGPERKVLAPLLAVYPDEMEQRELCERAGYTWGGGYFKPRGNLKKWGLVVYVAGEKIRASGVLFNKEDDDE